MTEAEKIEKLNRRIGNLEASLATLCGLLVQQHGGSLEAYEAKQLIKDIAKSQEENKL